jgi:hypothetical protein
MSQIRKVIFDNFNDVDIRFNNDQVLELLKKDETIDQTITIDNLESQFAKIEDDGLVRCIAQNFTTKWFKLYEKMEQLNCSSCNGVVFLGSGESKICYNNECGATL